MKYIKLITFLMISLQVNTVHASENSQLGKNKVYDICYIPTEMTVISQVYPDFFSDNEDFDASRIHQQMKHTFLDALETSLNENTSLDSYHNNPIFSYVMQHRNGYMQKRVHEWLLEWNLIENEEGFTPLGYSIFLDNAHIAEILLATPHINMIFAEKINPLHFAAKFNCKKVINSLLTIPSLDVNIPYTDGRTALHYAAQYGFIEILEILLAVSNINVNIQDEDGNTPLHLATNADKIDIIQILLRAQQLDLNIQNNNGETALYRAVNCSRVEIVKSLLRTSGINVNLQKKDGDTPLHMAVNLNNSEIVKLLLAASDINVNLQNEDGCTPLTLPKTEQIRALFIQAGKECDRMELMLSDQENTPLIIAVRWNNIKIAELLVEGSNEDDCNFLNIPSREQIKAILILMGEGRGSFEVADSIQTTDINFSDKENELLRIAVNHGLIDTVQLLLATPEIDVNIPDEDGETPLYYAVRVNRTDIVKLLLAAPGIDINISDKDGYTPLHRAVNGNRVDILRLLLAAPGIDVNIPDKDGDTPLDCAVDFNNIEVVKLLLTSPNINIDTKWTPLEMVRTHHMRELFAQAKQERIMKIIKKD